MPAEGDPRTIDDRLRTSLATVATTQEPADGWDDLVARHRSGATTLTLDAAHRPPRRRALAVAAVVLAAAATVGVVAIQADDPPVVSTTPASEPGPSTSAATATTGSVGGGIAPDEATEASAVVRALLDELRAGDAAAAAHRWNGYPDVFDDPAGIETALAAFAEEFGWLVGDPAPDLSVVASSGATVRPVVIAVVDRPDSGRRAAAFVVDTQGATGPQVVRLPTEQAATPAEGNAVSSGTTITVPTVPVEGAARAYVDGVEVPVEVDQDAGTSTITLPAGIGSSVTVALATASPEEPLAAAWWFPVDG